MSDEQAIQSSLQETMSGGTGGILSEVPADEWHDCFPFADIEKVLAYVAASWDDLRSRYPSSHQPSENEPRLTKSLADYCDDFERRRAFGIGGRFHAERSINSRGPAGDLKAKRRTDVEYQAPLSGRPVLVLEFKKLYSTKGNDWRKKYVDSGVLRFMQGAYVPNEPCGVMCGFAEDPSTEVTLLTTFLNKRHAQAALLLPFATGRHINIPSTIAPRVAAFDTRHVRSRGTAASSVDLVHVLFKI